MRPHQPAGSAGKQGALLIACPEERPPNDSESTRRLLLARFPVFSGLPAAQLDELLAAAPLRHASAGSVLFEPNAPCEGFPLVLEGNVRVAKSLPGGREIVLYRASAGEAWILSGSCLLSDINYAARGTAEGEVTLLRIPSDLFQQLIWQHPPLRRFVFDMYGARLAEVMELIEEVAFRKRHAAGEAADPAWLGGQRHTSEPGRRVGQRARLRQPAAAQLRGTRMGPSAARTHRSPRCPVAAGIFSPIDPVCRLRCSAPTLGSAGHGEAMRQRH